MVINAVKAMVYLRKIIRRKNAVDSRKKRTTIYQFNERLREKIWFVIQEIVIKKFKKKKEVKKKRTSFGPFRI